MNNLNFLRFINRTKILCETNFKSSGVLLQIAKRSTSVNLAGTQDTKQKQLFRDGLPGIIDTLMNSPKLYEQPEVSSWIKKVLNYNLAGGKHSRGMMTVMAYEMLEKPENITKETAKLAEVLGWCTEIVQALLCVIDDMMDESTTRRGVPCWYRIPEVRMGAVNDTVLISTSLRELIELYFLKTPHFVPLMRLMNEAILFTCMGQNMDITTANHTKGNYSQFTTERYETLVKYKTSYYTFRLPILLGLSLVKDFDKNLYADIDDISFKLGHLFQIQDDYIDCYGDEAETGKAGTDIQEGKCTWLATTALQHCNETQRDIFTNHYGIKNTKDVAIIKRLYDELQISELYKEKENEIYTDTIRRVQQLSWKTAPNFFLTVLGQIHKRKR